MTDSELRMQCLKLIWDTNFSDQDNFIRAEEMLHYILYGLPKPVEKSLIRDFDKDLEMASKAVANAIFRKKGD